jgi:hypothetical protein
MRAMENPEQPVPSTPPPASMVADTAVAATTSSRDVWERIKHHKVVQWTLAYLALAYTLQWHLPEYWRKHGFPPRCKPIGNSGFECP